MRKSSVKIVSFFGNEVSNYEFRRTSDRLSCKNLQINSYQLINASSKDASRKILEILKAIEAEATASLGILFGLWFANRWEHDTLVNRAIGKKRFLSKHGQHSIQFSNSGVVDGEGQILHWGDLEINDENFARFSAEISFNENGALFVCDRLRWSEFRARFIGQLADKGNYQMPPLSHLEIVRQGLTHSVSVITITNWVETDVIDFDLFKIVAANRTDHPTADSMPRSAQSFLSNESI